MYQAPPPVPRKGSRYPFYKGLLYPPIRRYPAASNIGIELAIYCLAMVIVWPSLPYLLAFLVLQSISYILQISAEFQAPGGQVSSAWLRGLGIGASCAAMIVLGIHFLLVERHASMLIGTAAALFILLRGVPACSLCGHALCLRRLDRPAREIWRNRMVCPNCASVADLHGQPIQRSRVDEKERQHD